MERPNLFSFKYYVLRRRSKTVLSPQLNCGHIWDASSSIRKVNRDARCWVDYIIDSSNFIYISMDVEKGFCSLEKT
jgi:hypothetical protein